MTALPLLAALAADSCLGFTTVNEAGASGNRFVYYRFSAQRLQVRPGDVLEYDVFLDPANPVSGGGIDVDFDDSGSSLRDSETLDDHGITAHGDARLPAASGAWLHREFQLEKHGGRTTRSWNLQFEGDRPGRYTQFIDNVRVRRTDGSLVTIYDNGPAPVDEMVSNDGYALEPALATVDRSRVDSASIAALAGEMTQRSRQLRALRDLRSRARLIERILANQPDPKVTAALDRFHAIERDLETTTSETAIAAKTAEARKALAPGHATLKKLKGHLVSHAHIDFQWLWEWQEGRQAATDTFRQVLRFMDEHPGLTFTQSSAGLYQSIAETDPDLIRAIRKRVSQGQWEVVGGRMCEGDTNCISGESHARHFLYGQRLLKALTGKRATVAWEPDTFGHTAQMPQIVQLGGCDSYYFCRGGKNQPLFWWLAPDGSRVMAFDESATGGWYNSDLTSRNFEEALDFQAKTGRPEMLWVYGVGNHGGGPSREHIAVAEQWKKNPLTPNATYSTARNFFDAARRTSDQAIPEIQDDLNTVFEGCYTTHNETKRLNRLAEAAMNSAEAAGVVAGRMGFHYPKEEYRSNWESILNNHHHDTMGGSGIHSTYDTTKIALRKVLASAEDQTRRALQILSVRVRHRSGGQDVLVFNPTGWVRSGWIETRLEQVSLTKPLVAEGGGNALGEVQIVDRPTKTARFFAPSVPAFGYAVYSIRPGEVAAQPVVSTSNGKTLQTPYIKVEIDPESGCVSNLIDLKTGQSVGRGLGALELHHEDPGEMSAWTLGPISKKVPWKPVRSTFLPDPVRPTWVFEYSIPSLGRPQPTTARVELTVPAQSRLIEQRIFCDWHMRGTEQTGGELLRAIFPQSAPNFTYETPFAQRTSPSDGREKPMLKWAIIGNLEVLNDSVHGVSAGTDGLRLSLVRSPYNPDPEPSTGPHEWNVRFGPRLSNSQTIRGSFELQQPLLAITVPPDAKGTAPRSMGLFDPGRTSLIPTAIKQSEDSDATIARFYESAGQSTQSVLLWTNRPERLSWVDFLEEPWKPDANAPQMGRLNASPWQILNLKIEWSKR